MPIDVPAQRVALFPTCVVDTVAPEVGEAVVRVLRRFGCEVSVPERATCCGQPAWNAGFARDAAEVAATTLGALEDALAEGPSDGAGEGPDTVVCVPAGSCATMIRVFWPELFHLAGDEAAVERARRVGAATRELSELLVERSGGHIDGGYERAVGYHHSCHMLRELGLREPPVQLLDGLDGCERMAWSAEERCCGFGGMFSVKLPETSVAMADDKLDALGVTGAAELVGCDQSCLLHLRGRLARRGVATPVKHLAQVLDEAGARPTPGPAVIRQTP
jgi:L-lactate dehydrogenase complex protein LldE